MKEVRRFVFVSLFICLLSTLNVVGQTTDSEKKVDKDEINKTIWNFSSEADERFNASHSRLEFVLKDAGKDIKEVFYFSVRDKKIEKLIFENTKDDFKASETYYFDKGKLVMVYEDEQIKDRNEWKTKWSLSITVHNDQVLDFVSNGHGKTETDDWEPKPIETSKKRLEKLREHLKSINL